MNKPQTRKNKLQFRFIVKQLAIFISYFKELLIKKFLKYYKLKIKLYIKKKINSVNIMNDKLRNIKYNAIIIL